MMLIVADEQLVTAGVHSDHGAAAVGEIDDTFFAGDGRDDDNGDGHDSSEEG